jgi:hypothetical protein
VGKGGGNDALAFFAVVGDLDIVPQIFQEFVDVELQLRGLFARSLHLQVEGARVWKDDQKVRPPVLPQWVQLGGLEAETPRELDHLLLNGGFFEVSHRSAQSIRWIVSHPSVIGRANTATSPVQNVSTTRPADAPVPTASAIFR